jgi:hypothetical protein
LDGGLGGASGSGAGGAEEITGGFGEDDFHDGFAEACGGDGAGFEVGVAAGADERRIADAAGKFTAGAAGGSGGEETALFIECDGADGALFVTAMMLGGVGVIAAALPGFALGGRDEIFGIAKGNALRVDEAFGALGDQHHVGTFFEDGASGLDGIFDAAETGDGAGAERGGVHDDGVTFDLAIEIEVGAVAGVEDGVVLEDGDGGFDGVEGVAAAGENGPAGSKSAETTGFAGVDGVVGDVPGTAVEDEGGAHFWRIADIGYQRAGGNQRSASSDREAGGRRTISLKAGACAEEDNVEGAGIRRGEEPEIPRADSACGAAGDGREPKSTGRSACATRNGEEKPKRRGEPAATGLDGSRGVR